WANSVSGEILELMAGTGRISIPLAREGARLTCIDNSTAMLAVLRRKLRDAGLRARVLCVDACNLPFDRDRFSLVLLPFQGFTELATAEDQLDLLRAVSSVLEASGKFVCTSHNPAVRLRSVDDTWREIGVFTRPDGGVLRLSLRTRYDEAARNVIGQQRVAVTDPSGTTSVMNVDLRFSLVSLEQMEELAGRAGLRIVSLHGDYSGGSYDPESSPAIIAVFEKAA
ncbi:MAG: class I SAM-dependent methyltransferase, partial [Thermoanaerobaculia bacterium]